MGAEASKPKPGTELRVIGAGLPRTGTSSFSTALSILLDGPVYHGGTQLLISGDEDHMKTWIDVLRHTPYRNHEEKEHVKRQFQRRLDGYAAATDQPAFMFVGELMELYPDAKIICTVRDPERWAESVDAVNTTGTNSLLTVLMYWTPCSRFVPSFLSALRRGRWGELYCDPGEDLPGRNVWKRHMEYLERTVPKEKLLYFDVRDGWDPLCEMLHVPVPDVPFPRVNDAKAVEELAKKQLREGLVRWTVVITLAFGVIATAWQCLLG